MAEKEPEAPQDFAEILRQHFAGIQDPKGRSRFQMSQRNQRKLEKIRERVRQLRGNQ